MKKSVLAILLLILVSVSGCAEQDTSQAGPYDAFNVVNRTYPVETVIYGNAYGASFTEVKYNDSGKGMSVNDMSTHTVDFYRYNTINIVYVGGNESFLTHEYERKVYDGYPFGIYTLYLARNTPVCGTSTEFRSGGHAEEAQTNIVYQRTGP